MIKANILAGIALLCLLVACGKDKPLDSEQKGKLKELNASVSTVQSSGEAAGQKRSFIRGATAPTNSNQQMVDKISSSECDFPVSESSSSGFSMKISGDKCPIAMDWGMKVSGDVLNVNMTFEIKDAELAKLSDVTKYSLSGAIGKDGGGLSGSITSKKYGEVGISLNVSGNESEATVEITYKFTDFEAKIRAEINKDGTKYFLNGEEMSNDEFKTMGGSAGTAGTSGTNTTTTSSSSFSYDYTSNGCATGKHTFASNEELCVGLQSTSLNKGCAEDLRRSGFKSYSCSGTFTVKP